MYVYIMLPKIKNNQTIRTPKIHPEFDFKLNFDGCSKGNPGLSGAGAVIYCLDDEIWADSLFVGTNCTNNYAEYSGLIFGLNKAIEMKIKKLLVIGDSLLVINHMKGIYRCNSINLMPLFNKAKDLEKQFDSISYEHILRNKNKRADALSNIAIDKNYLSL